MTTRQTLIGRARKRTRGIALAIVLVLVMLLITAVYTFSRRAVINYTISKNRIAAAEADALARGGLRMAEAVVFLARLQDEAGDAAAAAGGTAGAGSAASALASALGSGTDLWTVVNGTPIELEGGQLLELHIEEAGGKLNLNALVPQTAGGRDGDGDGDGDSDGERGVSAEEEALEYLVQVMRHIIEGIETPPEDRYYDAREIAENLLDYMDADGNSLGGGGENGYYQQQEPPYQPRNGPFLSFEEVGLVEGIDPLLLDVMRDYLTIYPIGGTTGIDINRAEPWVLPLVYSGPSGDRELLSERDVRQILRRRKNGELICTEASASKKNCVTLNSVGLGEGSIYPETPLPMPVAVFRVTAEARVGNVTRRMEAVYDTRPAQRPQLLSWRHLRGDQ